MAPANLIFVMLGMYSSLCCLLVSNVTAEFVYPTLGNDRPSTDNEVVLDGLVVIVFAIGPKVRGYKPGRGRWIFKGDKNLQHAFLRREK
jgi:hypothetical protein